MKKDNIIIYDKNNVAKEYQLLAVYDEKYIIYKDIDNHDNDKNLYAAKYIRENDKMKLFELDDNEWDLIEKKYQELLNSLE